MRLIGRLFLSETLILLALLSMPAGFALGFQQTPARSQISSSAEDRIDINTATIDQLMKVPGMTRTWAARIIRFRPYRAKNDLIERGIVTSQVYDRIKDRIIAHRAAR